MKNNNKTTICPSCKFEYDSLLKECPNCHYRVPLSFNITLWIFILMLIPVTLFHYLSESNFEFKNNAQEISNKQDYVVVKPNKMEELSYLSKDEIINKRIKVVQNSDFFKDENYKPRTEVYQIEDNLPWISIYELARYGIEQSKDISKGPSRQSISIKNPEVLLSVLAPQFSKRDNEKYFSEYDYFFPTKIMTNKKEKFIEVHFDFSNFFRINPQYRGFEAYLDDTNARDFNYDWIYASKSKNITFVDSENFSKKLYKLKGYYHKGFSCKIESGCNNYSPYQKETIFNILDTPSYIEFKLWKNKPSSIFKDADLTYRMVFE